MAYSSKQRWFRLLEGGRGYSPSLTMGHKKSLTRYLHGAEGVEWEEGMGAGRDWHWLDSGVTPGGGRQALLRWSSRGWRISWRWGCISPARDRDWGCSHCCSPGGSFSGALRDWGAQSVKHLPLPGILISGS